MKHTWKQWIVMLLVLVMLLGVAPMTVLAAGGQPEEDEAPQPILYLDMEDITDNTIKNIVNETQEFTIGGTATLEASVNGSKAMRFDGTTYIALGTELGLTNAYTLAGWFWQESGATDGQALFARGNSGNVKDQLAVLVKNEMLHHFVSVGSTNEAYFELNSPANAAVGQWNHFAVTRDGTQVTLYINGISVKTAEISTADFAAATLPMYIGMDCDSNGSLYNKHAFQGLMDEMRIYDAALTEAQIQEMYQAEIPYELGQINNGELQLHFLNKPATAPEQEDISVEFRDGDRVIKPEVTKYQYDQASNKAIVGFKPLENHTAQEKIISVTTEYAGFTLSGTFTIAASDNQAPTAQNAKIVNLSTKLGDDPHVKGILEVQYQYTDPDQDAEGETKYQWLIADSLEGSYTELQGINTNTIILLDKYEGKYLKCRVTPSDCYGNMGEAVLSDPTSAPVAATQGNPLTDWLYEGGYGLSHHFLANYFNAEDVYREEREKWDIENVSWNDFISQFDVEKYAEQVNAVGAQYVTLTMGQNNGYYLAPSETYDKYLREAGLLGENETNPMTAEYDLPMKLADALAKYDIKLMLYLPANPPHSAHWNTEGSSGYGFIGTDYKVTTEVFDYTPGTDGVPSQRARKVVTEMVKEWSERYGDKIAGWWFDGVFSGALLNGWKDMSLEYNIATLANAAKAGNPYSIVTFNPGLGADRCFVKTNDYQDYTAGENGALTPVPQNPGRWTEDSTDCQKYTFGVMGSTSSWKGGWGCKGTSKTTEQIIERIQTGLDNDCAMSLDTRVNVFGEIDPDQFQQLMALKIAIRDGGVAPDVESITLDRAEGTLEVIGDRMIVKPTLTPLGASVQDLKITVENPDIAEVKSGASGTFDIIAKQAGTTKVVFESTKNAQIRAVCTVVVHGREPQQIVDDMSAQITYQEGEWLSISDRNTPDPDGYYEYEKTVHANQNAGATATFTFTGTGFDYMTSYNIDQGKVSIQIDDGEPVIIDLSVPGGAVKKSFYMNAYGVYNLPKSEHTVVLKNLDEGRYFIVDAIRIYDEEVVNVPVTSVTLNKDKAELEVGDTLTLTATVKPAEATNRNVTWSSSNTTVAEVVDGVVTAKKAGTATITVTTEDGDKRASCTVTVNNVVAPTYSVTVTTDGKGTASAAPAAAEAGTEITLNATPDRGYHFKNWEAVTDGVTITGNTFTMPDKNVEIYAAFEAHVKELRGKKPATWLEEGYTGDVYCAVCDKLLEKGEVIPRRGSGIDWFPGVPDTKPSWELPFTDVAEGAWYYESVYYAWDEELIDGVTADQYQPDGSLTVAQTIKLAAALHEKLNRGYVTLENGTANWYDTYVDYAVNNGIIAVKYQSYTKAQMDAAITRNEFVHIFHGAMDDYKAINDVADNTIPDVKLTDVYADEIYDFYRAGILTGSDGTGTFNGKSTIKRSEVATILVRMFDESMREQITL